MIRVTRADELPWERLRTAWEEIAESRQYTNRGPVCTALEQALGAWCGIPGVCTVANGHLSLELAIEALGLRQNPVWNEVVTTPFTFPSTIQAILREGLRPVYCDVDPDSGCLNPAGLEACIGGRTAAILPVHVYGNVCDDAAIEAIAGKYRLPVIFDAAHAFGEEVAAREDALVQEKAEEEGRRKAGEGHREEGGRSCVRECGGKESRLRTETAAPRTRSVLGLGTVSCCSFHATKVYTTAEGGAVFSRHSALTDRVRQLENFGLTAGGRPADPRLSRRHTCGGTWAEDPSGLFGARSMNAKLDEFRAAIGLELLPMMKEMTASRERRCQQYLAGLSGIPGLVTVLPRQEPLVSRNYGYLPVVIEDVRHKNSRCAESSGYAGERRDRGCRILLANGIQARKYFYPLVPEMPAIARACRTQWGEIWTEEKIRRLYPNAWYLSRHVLCLPIYPDLPPAEVDRICAVIREAMAG